MEIEKKKCTSKDHGNILANSYCQECKIYICKECEKIHSKICIYHHTYNLNVDENEVFTGICKVGNHSDELKYFCRTHNSLCCAACISKIKDEENGQHKDCSVCPIKNIKKNKKNKLKDNIKILDDLSITLTQSIIELKNIFEKISENKENLSIKVQKIFTKLRNALNEREDKLLSDINNNFNNIFFKDEIIEKCDKMPNIIKKSLEKGKIINNEWNDSNNLSSLIFDCINIENNIEYINNMNKNIKKCKSMNMNVKFIPEENEIDYFLKYIENFGEISYNNFSFKKCPENININRKYNVSGEENNIITKCGTDNQWMGTICNNQLDNSKEYIWTIKILSSKYNNIIVGIAPIEFDINSSLFDSDNNGIFYDFSNGLFYNNYKKITK